MIAAALKDYLTSIDALRDRLSAPEWGVRIRVGRIPQGMPLPFVRLGDVDGACEYHLSGELEGLAQTVQVDIWSASARETAELAELIRGYDAAGALVSARPLSGFAGTWNGIVVEAVTLTAELTRWEPPQDGGDRWLCRHTADYRVSYIRPVVTV